MISWGITPSLLLMALVSPPIKLTSFAGSSALRELRALYIAVTFRLW
jgi:hypothetical protein